MKIVSLLNGKSLRQFVFVLLVGAVFAFALSLFSSAPAQAQHTPIHYFVSKNGDNSDGLTWATAWNEMDQIHWNLIAAYRGDDLTIDGGAINMVYNTPMTQTLASAPFPVPVKVSTQSGHSGTVYISGNGQSGSGIKLQGPGGIFLDGIRRSGIVVTGWSEGIEIVQGSHHYVEHCDFTRNKLGVHFRGGFNNVVRKCTIHDNASINVLIDPPSVIMSALTLCWVYNSSYKVNSDGVQVGDGTNWSSCMVSNCVLGPALRVGVRMMGSNGMADSVSNCLLINATDANIYSAKGLICSRVTSFMTKLNPHGYAHACVALGAPSTNPPNNDTIVQSIYWGGVVKISNSIPVNVQSNTQYKVTGNTTLLAPTQVDPMFVTNVGAFPDNVPLSTLMQADFALRPGSPAHGTGSDVTSVNQLLSQF